MFGQVEGFASPQVRTRSRYLAGGVDVSACRDDRRDSRCSWTYLHRQPEREAVSCCPLTTRNLTPARMPGTNSERTFLKSPPATLAPESLPTPRHSVATPKQSSRALATMAPDFPSPSYQLHQAVGVVRAAAGRCPLRPAAFAGGVRESADEGMVTFRTVSALTARPRTRRTISVRRMFIRPAEHSDRAGIDRGSSRFGFRSLSGEEVPLPAPGLEGNAPGTVCKGDHPLHITTLQKMQTGV